MKEYKININKTARYFTLGKLNSDTKILWIVLHGYGQMAKFFLRKFSVLNVEHTFVVAPEAMNKFYLNGFSGRVGAAWMTKEDRETEILDNFKYLENCFSEITKGVNRDNIYVNVLGFSQGTKTASRWILNSSIQINNLILWGGSLPPETDFKFYKKRLNSFNLHLVVGEKDEFISKEKVKDELIYLEKNNIKYSFTSYKGRHDIDKNVLNKFVAMN